MNTTAPYPIDEIQNLLKNSVSEVFRTMFDMAADPMPTTDIRGQNEVLVAGSVGFTGEVNGVVYVYTKASFARLLACKMLGLTEADLEGDEMVNDVIGELTNMIVGAVKSLLCDSGTPCVLTIPSVVRGTNFAAAPACSAESRLLSIDCGVENILVELLMKQSK